MFVRKFAWLAIWSLCLCFPFAYAQSGGNLSSPEQSESKLIQSVKLRPAILKVDIRQDSQDVVLQSTRTPMSFAHCKSFLKSYYEKFPTKPDLVVYRDGKREDALEEDLMIFLEKLARHYKCQLVVYPPPTGRDPFEKDGHDFESLLSTFVDRKVVPSPPAEDKLMEYELPAIVLP